MSFDHFLHPRPEVLDDTIAGIVDLANLREQGRLESEPARFFSVTYPTNDIVRVVQALDARFSQERADIPGLFLFEGLKGSGKSHLLLLIYHLLEHREEAENWLAEHRLTCRLPRDVTVIVNKFTDDPLGSIWDLLYRRFAGRSRGLETVQPGLEEIQSLIGDHRLVLILDELERGIQSIGDSAVRMQNLNFLQMLSEWANRSAQVTLFASIYSDLVEPGETLKRVSPVRVQFQHASDRARVVMYRLFENYTNFEPRAVRPIVDSYINIWRRQIVFNADEYAAQMLEAYPFSPDLLNLLLERVPARGGFQNVRGALGFLAHLVRMHLGRVHLITPGLAYLTDREVAIRLSDLDPNQLVHRARNNLTDLQAIRPPLPLLSELVSSTLLYTLTGAGRNMGASREELVRGAMVPDGNINDMERTLLALQRYAANFHVAEGRYFFDQEETPDAKVELRALPKNDVLARAELRTILQNLFNDTNAVVFTDVNETREALGALDNSDLRYVLAPHALSPEVRHELYYGLPVRNQVILLEPGERTFNLNENPDLLKWAKRYLAAGELADLSQGDARRTYDRIKLAELGQINDYLKRIGLRYVRFDAYGASAGQDEVDEESLSRAMTAQEVRNVLSIEFYPRDLIVEHLRNRLGELRERTVREVEQEYKATLGFPVPAKAHSVPDAIRELCADERRLISLIHPTRGGFCGQRPQLSHTELLEATVESPLDPVVLRDGSRPQGEGQGLPRLIDDRPAGETVIGRQPTDVQIAGRDEGTGEVHPPEASVSPSVLRRELAIRYQPTPGQLRQEIAFQFQDAGDVRVLRVRFSILVEQSRADLGRFSSGLRGSLTGEGDLTAEIVLTFDGEYAKSAVEQMAEQLPAIPGGEYTATLTLQASGSGGQNSA
ncbi:MAG: AAA family ATPase [Anaerolineae bacterium]|nr:AAA family ATPase [Anaerolineae bacterium]